MTGTTFKKLKTFGIQTWNEINASNKQNNNINKQQKNNIPINAHFDRYKKQRKKEHIDTIVKKLMSTKKKLSKNDATKLAQEIYNNWLKDGTGPIDLFIKHIKWFNTPETKTAKRRNVEMPVNWSANGVENKRFKEQPKRKRQNCPSQMQVVIVAFERALDLLRKDLQTINVTLKEMR